MARIHGKNGIVQMDAAGGTSYVTIGDISAWDLSLEKDLVGATAFGDTNVQSLLGLPKFNGNIKGFWNNTSSPALFAAIIGSSAVGLKLVMDSTAPTYNFSGLGYLDGSVNVDVNNAVTFAGKFTAASNWVIAP